MTPACALTIVTLLGPVETIPPGHVTTDARIVADFQQRIAKYLEIRRPRPAVKEGDIFDPAAAAAFRARIANALRVSGGAAPAIDLLRALPDLPPELEYQFMGRHLVLVDVHANHIVDVLRNALPAANRPRDIGPPDPCAVHPDLPVCWM